MEHGQVSRNGVDVKHQRSQPLDIKKSGVIRCSAFFFLSILFLLFFSVDIFAVTRGGWLC